VRHRLRGRRDRNIRGGNLRRDHDDAQIGFIDPSLRPRKAEVWKAEALAVEDQREEQRMEQ